MAKRDGAGGAATTSKTTTRHEPGDVIEVASELMARDEAKPEVDLHEIGAELGVPAKYVDQAVVELDRRRLARRRRFLVVAGLVGVVGLAAYGIRSSPNRGKAAPLASPAVAPLSATKSVRGIQVGVDLVHGVSTESGVAELQAGGASAKLLQQPLTDETLHGLDVLALLEARRTFTDDEIQAVVRFVRGGHGLVASDLGWSWVTYEKRPLAELPINRIGSALGAFELTNDVLGPPARFDPPQLAAMTARKTPWVPCGVRSLGGPHRALVRDEQLRPMVSAVEVEKGHAVLFGHTSIVTENPALFVLATAIAADR